MRMSEKCRIKNDKKHKHNNFGNPWSLVVPTGMVLSVLLLQISNLQRKWQFHTFCDLSTYIWRKILAQIQVAASVLACRTLPNLVITYNKQIIALDNEWMILDMIFKTIDQMYEHRVIARTYLESIFKMSQTFHLMSRRNSKQTKLSVPVIFSHPVALLS